MIPPSKPFTQGRFAELPELPHHPHVYHQSTPVELTHAAPGWPPLRTHVRVYGSGPPLFLVHGLMTSSYSWRYAMARLGEHYTCYAPDLPSAGRSAHALELTYSPTALAVWLGSCLQALDIVGCPIIGNSLGGYLCMHLALDQPEALSKLVNLHSPGVPEPRLYALGAAFKLPGTRALLSRMIRRNPLKWAHRNVHYYDESYKSLEEAREYGQPLSSPEGAQGFIKYLAETVAVGPMKRFQKRLSERKAHALPFPVPLLLIYSERDPMVPPRFGDVFARAIPDSRLLRLAAASHFAHVDATERFVAPVLEFLK